MSRPEKGRPEGWIVVRNDVPCSYDETSRLLTEEWTGTASLFEDRRKAANAIRRTIMERGLDEFEFGIYRVYRA